MRLGTTELLLIVVLAVIVFGGGKISGLGKALGQSIREFKKETKGDDSDAKSTAGKSPEADTSSGNQDVK